MEVRKYFGSCKGQAEIAKKEGARVEEDQDNPGCYVAYPTDKTNKSESNFIRRTYEKPFRMVYV